MSLILHNVSKVYNKKTVVENLSFEVNKGTILGVLGRNGAGKTTTFRIILGLIEPSSGNVTFKGNTIDKNLYNYMGYLPEERGLHTKLTVYEELKYMSKLKGMKKKEVERWVKYWLKEFEMEDYKEKKIEQLSKGNQQKIQLLVSIMHNPELIILDEPFSGLDPVNVELLKKSIHSLKKNNRTIILSTHRMDHVDELCDEILIINNGKKVIQDSIQNLRNTYEEKKLIIEGKGTLKNLNDIKGIKNIEMEEDKIIVTIENKNVSDIIFENIKSDFIITRFQIIEPSLSEIFIDKVGAENE